MVCVMDYDQLLKDERIHAHVEAINAIEEMAAVINLPEKGNWEDPEVLVIKKKDWNKFKEGVK